MSPEQIGELQRRIGPTAATARSRTDYRRIARWWELEAQRGYESAEKSRGYGRNMRWAAELAETHGPGTWVELNAKSKARDGRATAGNPSLRKEP